MEIKYVLAIAIVVAVSGCADSEISNSSTTEKTTPVPQKGLKVASLSITDNTLTPEQEAIVNLQLKNYHTESIEVEDITLFNTGLLEREYDSSDGWKKRCKPDELRVAEPGKDGSEPRIPTMECSWRIKAPSEKGLGAFESKTESISVQIAYSSEIENRDPFKITFKPLSDIQSTKTVSKEFSNSEVSVSMEAESPLSFQGGNMDFRVEEIGEGYVNGSYSFGYTPESIFDTGSCPEEDKTVVGNDVQLSCPLGLENEQEATRNVFFSTSYKYVKTSTLDVEVVKP